ncbi:Actin cross-linking toxin VgrG1 [Pandoraea terrae]|uniref:Actin cross-linking toxin VgrG1 n=1 Tax=Pandoraea terrae TaxID=1537710 RepID=A0A5E4TCJ4_9BURK|nr:type VI secretion system Vgr family protein [Pandoraea terrae]VVD85635.1 Actin cross-linking toxin VgrG1 [Pandoraea terrae]
MQTLQDVLQYPSARLTQHLRLSIGTLDTPIDVLSFRLEEGFNETYVADITVTSINKAIDAAACVGRRATFAIDEEAAVPSMPGLVTPVVEPARIVHGVVTQWERVKASRDEATYRLRIEPRVALLEQVHDSGLFQNKSLKELITELVVDRKRFDSYDVEFALEDAQEQFEQTVMYEETVWNFISRHCLRAGFYYYFKQGREGAGPRRDTIVFGNNPAGYVRALDVPMMPYSGLSGNWHEAVLAISEVRTLVPSTVELREHNYRTPADPLKVESRIASDDLSAYGSVNRSAEHHHTAEIGEMLADARRDELIARQTTFNGKSNVLGMMPGMVVRLTNHPLPGAEHGVVITRLVTKGSRSEPVINEFEAIPSHLTYRAEYIPEKHWRWVAGTLVGVVESGDEQPYAWLDEHGRYRVKPHFLRNAGKRGMNSMPLRLLRPAASYQGGFHSPLLPGTEVRLQCTNGDVDRMYIAGALHDDAHPDIVHGKAGWYSRAVWRSPLLGAKIRMEDLKDREGVKIATVYAKSSVSLGYLVDNQKKKRGEGFELTTEGWGTVRAAKGLMLSADSLSSPAAPQLEMQAALKELQSALSRVTTLVNATAQAEAAPADKEMQAGLMNALDQLKSAGLIASASGGIALATPRSIQQAAGENVFASAGKHVDISAMKRITLAAGELISLCAHKLGLKLFAAKGKVEIQAQSDALDLLAEKQLRVASTSADVLVSGKTKAVMASSGACVKMENGSVDFMCTGEFTIKAASFRFEGPDGVSISLPALPKSDLSPPDDGYALSH